MDSISDLPKLILHNILSRLPREDAARTSVLSKTWKDTWSTFPILVFSEKEFGISRNCVDTRDFQKAEDLRKKTQNFFDYVDRKMQNFHCQGLAIKEFRLYMTMRFYDRDFFSSCIDHWMKLASESSVEVVCLYISSGDSLDDEYYLSPSLLEAKTLNKLELFGPFRVDQALLNHPIKFSSLRVLSLCHVYLGDDQVMQNLFSSCPLIEYMTLRMCSGLKSIAIGGLRMLKRVEALGIQEFIVDAPSLEEFFYCPSDLNAPFKANLDSCKNLRELKLHSLKSAIINDQWLVELFSKFPLLESLILSSCTVSESLNVSSFRLRIFELKGLNVKEINIDAPNLYSFRYYAFRFMMPMISLVNCSSQLKADVRLCIRSYLGFPKLREFLQNFKPLSILAPLRLDIFSLTDVFNQDILQEIPISPPFIKHLDLCIFIHDETKILPLVTCLLWSCCPSIISLLIHFEARRRILIKVLCEKLMARKEECYCGLSTIECWWHSLKDVEIEGSSWENKKVDSMTFLDSLPNLLNGESVSLRLKW